ncbi:hypothetical protein V8D89_010240 [Ganoderma adspersum]
MAMFLFLLFIDLSCLSLVVLGLGEAFSFLIFNTPEPRNDIELEIFAGRPALEYLRTQAEKPEGLGPGYPHVCLRIASTISDRRTSVIAHFPNSPDIPPEGETTLSSLDSSGAARTTLVPPRRSFGRAKSIARVYRVARALARIQNGQQLQAGMLAERAVPPSCTVYSTPANSWRDLHDADRTPFIPRLIRTAHAAGTLHPQHLALGCSGRGAGARARAGEAFVTLLPRRGPGVPEAQPPRGPPAPAHAKIPLVEWSVHEH